MRSPILAAATAALLLSAADARAQTGLNTAQVASGFSLPLYLVSPPGDTDRLFIVEQRGEIKIIKNGVTLGTPFLDVGTSGLNLLGSNGNEQGLLGLAFHPDYANNGRFFINYTNSNDDTVVEALHGQRQPRHRQHHRHADHRADLPAPEQPQRRLPAVRAGRRHALHRHGRRRQLQRHRRGSRGGRQRAVRGHPARQDPAPRRRHRLPAHPRRQPVRQRPEHARRDLGLRGAQPVALELRRRTATCSSATWAKTPARRSTTSRRAWAGATTAGAAWRASAAPASAAAPATRPR